MADLAALKAEAKELGVNFKNNWGYDRLSAAIAKHKSDYNISDEVEPEMEETETTEVVAEQPELIAEPEAVIEPDEGESEGAKEPEAAEPDEGDEGEPEQFEPVKYQYTGKNPFALLGRPLKNGDTMELLEHHLADERLVAKVKTAVRCGLLKEL